MKLQDIIDTAKMLVSSGKGLLAMDKSNPTCNKFQVNRDCRRNTQTAPSSY
jgi:hypothetical protein